jgi:hypothetical protein
MIDYFGLNVKAVQLFVLKYFDGNPRFGFK